MMFVILSTRLSSRVQVQDVFQNDRVSQTTAVHEAQYVLAAIDARGEASRVLGQDKDGKGRVVVGDRSPCPRRFRARKIQLCCTIAVGLGQISKTSIKGMFKSELVSWS